MLSSLLLSGKLKLLARFMPFLSRKSVRFTLILLLLWLAYRSCMKMLTEDYVFATLNVGERREIVIWTDPFYDNCQAYYYQIKINENTTKPKSFIGCNEIQANFRLIASKDWNLVGVVEAERPNILLVTHDFKTGETWPKPGYTEALENLVLRGRRLRDRLQADIPNAKLVLRGDEFSSDVNTDNR
jgi:hypothetical protein